MKHNIDTPHSWQIAKDGGHKADRRTYEGKAIYKDAIRATEECDLDIHPALFHLTFGDLTKFLNFENREN